MNSQIINKRLKILDELKTDLNVLKEQLDDYLGNDAHFQEIVEEEQKLKDELKNKKSHILENATVLDLKERMKEIRDSMKDNREALSLELVEYYKEHGTLEFEDEDGNIRKLKFSVRLTS